MSLVDWFDSTKRNYSVDSNFFGGDLTDDWDFLWNKRAIFQRGRNDLSA